MTSKKSKKIDLIGHFDFVINALEVVKVALFIWLCIGVVYFVMALIINIIIWCLEIIK